MPSPLFSIIVPTHDRPERLVIALASVLAQSCTDWEVIVVDDGSEPPVQLPASASTYPVHLHRIANAGPGAARAHGAAQAGGRLLCFLDDDDYYLPEHLESVANAYDGGEALYCVGVLLKSAQGELSPTAALTDGADAAVSYWRNPVSLLRFVIPAIWLQRIPMIRRPSPIEDFEWLIRLLARAEVISIPTHSVVYVEHNANRTNTLVSRDDLHARERAVGEAYQDPEVAKRISLQDFRRQLTHQRLHWTRQGLRASQLKNAFYGLSRGLKGADIGNAAELSYTLLIAARQLFANKQLQLKISRYLTDLKHRLVRKARRPLVRRLLSRNTFAAQDALVIFSEARSGSTWLMELLQQLPGVVTNYEPFHLHQAMVPTELGWWYMPVAKPGKTTTAETEYLLDVLSYRSMRGWTTQYVSIKDAATARLVLLKCVRANQLMEWITDTLSLNYKPILLVRHPLASALSSERSFAGRVFQPIDWNNVPVTLQNERYRQHHEYYSQLSTDLERRVATWCIDNVDLLSNRALLSKVVVVHYESLLLRPADELSKILREWKLPGVAPDFLEYSKFERPSVTDHYGDYISQPQRQLRKAWELTTQAQRDQVQAVFDYFSFTLYNCDDPMPQNFPT